MSQNLHSVNRQEHEGAEAARKRYVDLLLAEESTPELIEEMRQLLPIVGRTPEQAARDASALRAAAGALALVEQGWRDGIADRFARSTLDLERAQRECESLLEEATARLDQRLSAAARCCSASASAFALWKQNRMSLYEAAQAARTQLRELADLSSTLRSAKELLDDSEQAAKAAAPQARGLQIVRAGEARARHS